MILKREREKKKVNSLLSTQRRLCSAPFPTSCCLLTSSLFSFEVYVFALVSLHGFSGRPSERPGWGLDRSDTRNHHCPTIRKVHPKFHSPPVKSGRARKTLVGELSFVGKVLCGQWPPNR